MTPKGALEKCVLEAISEVLTHPHGGKIEVYVNVGDRPGERVVKIQPSLFGLRNKRLIIDVYDD